MKAKPFHFKQFTIHQDKTAMKVGTDGVLLGAWTNSLIAEQILDIGAGTGVISLMLAQKTTAKITAIEIDPNAAKQCIENFKSSVWSERLNLQNISIQEFESNLRFDVIISNPPFFNSQKIDSARNIARSENELTLKELISAANNLLSASGKVFLVLPFDRQTELLELIKINELFLNKVCYVSGNPTSKIKRILVEISRGNSILKETNLIIEGTNRHDYTVDYKNLMKDYLTIF